jgi:hypothetical protein
MARISRSRIGEYVYTALQVVADNDGVLPSGEVGRNISVQIQEILDRFRTVHITD